MRIEPSELPELPVSFMNADHLQEIRLVNDLEEALAAHSSGGADTLDPVLAKLALLAVHSREHFLREESAMRVTRYPGYLAHKADHDRILAEMDREARLFRERGDVARLSRYLFEALPARYRAHVRALDAATAEHLAEHDVERSVAS
jgi:hemerythrin